MADGRFGEAESTQARPPHARASDGGRGALASTASPGDAYRDLVENANDIFYTHDLAGRFTSVNRAAERILGHSRDDLLQMSIEDVVAADSFEEVRQALGGTLKGHRRRRYELAVVARDGRRLWLEVSARVLFEADQAVAIQGIARDITDRKHAEQELRNSEERFRLLVDNSSDGLQLLAPDGRVFFCSRPVTRMLGYGVEEIVGRHVFAVAHADERERLSWTLAECLSRPGVPLMAEYRAFAKSGAERRLEATLVNRLKEPGIGAVVMNFRDVTDRRIAEDALEESEERFRAVFEAAMVGIVWLDLRGIIIEANRAAASMGAYSAEEIRGKHFSDLIHPDDSDAGMKAFGELVSGQRDSYQAERRYRAKDGTPFWVNVTASLVSQGNGEPRFCIALLENISERKRTEEELVETNKRLSIWIEELEQRTREISLLSELGDMLQACKTADEAYEVVAPVATQLFPKAGGVLAVTPGTGSVLEPVASWGGLDATRPFTVDECWAIRRGRPHVIEDAAEGVLCRHLQHTARGACVCIPMIAHGELLGVFSLVLPERGRALDSKRRLGMTVAEHVALALANLKLHDTLRSQSIRDPLTGLFNRRYMEESLEREMRRASRSRVPVGIIMLDIDHFKEFNDTYGHAAGDALLKAVGAMLQRSVRAEDIACRYGGEEFILILPEASLTEASQRAEYLREAIKNIVITHGKQTLPPVSISAGVAIFPDHGPNTEVVLRAADTALYRAKRVRDRVVVSRAGSLFDEGLSEADAN